MGHLRHSLESTARHLRRDRDRYEPTNEFGNATGNNILLPSQRHEVKYNKGLLSKHPEWTSGQGHEVPSSGPEHYQDHNEGSQESGEHGKDRPTMSGHHQEVAEDLDKVEDI